MYNALACKGAIPSSIGTLCRMTLLCRPKHLLFAVADLATAICHFIQYSKLRKSSRPPWSRAFTKAAATPAARAPYNRAHTACRLAFAEKRCTYIELFNLANLLPCQKKITPPALEGESCIDIGPTECRRKSISAGTCGIRRDVDRVVYPCVYRSVHCRLLYDAGSPGGFMHATCECMEHSVPAVTCAFFSPLSRFLL
ncbi:hypothetical protein EVAR_65973_1 [Eumeta japonica]|uniref:Uncharacterized protein n=1 Tax=Eumeta variegata TaxID=151549 RepID=A0A4C2A3A1_EUMVA|nr:hypothetical protein EVAR_65973_1 [Eumeta japonica]